MSTQEHEMSHADIEAERAALRYADAGGHPGRWYTPVTMDAMDTEGFEAHVRRERTRDTAGRPAPPA